MSFLPNSPDLRAHILSEQFTNDSIVVTLAWTVEGHLLYNSLCEVDVHVVPQIVTTFNFSGRTTVQFQVVYDIWYNVSVIVSALCGQRNVTYFTMMLHYGEYDH